MPLVWVCHWLFQTLATNICSKGWYKKRRNLQWFHLFESGIIRWMQSAGSQQYARSIIIHLLGTIFNGWQIQWSDWNHKKECAENDSNMLLFIHSITIDWGYRVKNSEKNEPYLILVVAKICYVSEIIKHSYRTNIWQDGSWWNQEKLNKLSISHS